MASASDLIRIRGTAKSKFTRKCTIFQELVTNEEPLPILEAAYQEIIQAFVSLEILCDEFIAHLNDDREASGQTLLIESATAYIEEVERKKVSMSKLLIQQKSTHAIDCSKINVKKLEPPRSGGKV